MASNGVLQVVEDVDGSESEDEAPTLNSTSRTDAAADDDGPPPLTSEEEEEEEDTIINLSSADTLPQNGGAPGREEDSSAGFSSDDGSLPHLAGDSDDELTGSDDDEVPDLDDPESDEEDEEPGDDDSDSMPPLEVDKSDSDGDGDEPSSRNAFGLRSGFLGPKAAPHHSQGYSNQGVGQREEGPTAAAAAARRKQDRQSAPYTGAGAGAREDLRSGPSARKQHSSASSSAAQANYYAGRGNVPDFTGPMREAAAAAAAAAAASAKATARDSKQSWAKQKDKKFRPDTAATAAPEPQRPAEVVQDRSALEVFRKEQEDKRRALNMHRQEQAAAVLPIGRCCLNRGLHNKVEHCRQDEEQARVWPFEKRMMMKCSAGCMMFWHIPCWRIFQEGYEAETRELSSKQQGINITQALKVRDKTKPPVVHCVTPGCPGYINFLGSFEGPLGHETFRAPQYQPTQENLNAIKEAMQEDKTAAKEARTAAVAAKAASALEAWRRKTGWKPGAPKKKRKRKPKAHRQQDQQRQAAAKEASPIVADAGAVRDQPATRSSEVPPAPGAASSSAAAAAAAAGAGAPAKQSGAAAAAVKPMGIKVKLAPKPIICLPKVAPAIRQSIDEEDVPASPAEGSAAGSANVSAGGRSLGHRDEAEDSQDLGRPSDHHDATYHSSIGELLSHQQQANDGTAVGRKKKKMNPTLHVEQFHMLIPGDDFVQAEQQRQEARGIRPRPPRQVEPDPSAEGASQQRPPAAAVPAAGEFPTLDQAMRHGGREQAIEPDYLAQALQELKIRADDQQKTAFVLLECVDFYMMKKGGEDPEAVIRKIIKEKTGGRDVAMRLFEKQEAVAVILDEAHALQAYLLCRFQLHRKRLQPSFLRHFPWDAELHEACPQYLTAEMRQQQQQQHAAQQPIPLEQQQQVKAADSRPPHANSSINDKVRAAKLAELQKAQLPASELLAQLQALGGEPITESAGASSSNTAAFAESSAAAATASTHQPKVLLLGSGSGGSDSQRTPSMQLSEQQRRQPSTADAPTTAEAVTSLPLQQRTTVRQDASEQAGPSQPHYAWRQQQQQEPWHGGSFMWHQHQHSAQQYESHQSWLHGQNLEASSACEGGVDGDWHGGAWSELGDMGAREIWQEGQEVQAGELHEHGETLTQSVQQGWNTTSTSALGTPIIKLNPEAKQFKLPNMATSLSTTPVAPLLPSDCANATNVDPSSRQPLSVDDSLVQESGGVEGGAESNMGSTTHLGLDDAVKGEQRGSTTSHTMVQHVVNNNSNAEFGATGGVSGIVDNLAWAGSIGSRPLSPRTSASVVEPSITIVGSSSMVESSCTALNGSQAVQTSPSFLASEQLPINHRLEVVFLVGCNTQQILQLYRNPQTPMFALSHAFLPGIESIGSEVRAIGLILYNNDSSCVEGLWVAVDRSDNNINWTAVAEYKEVPATVYGQVVSLNPYKNLYVGTEALSICRTLWEWKLNLHTTTASAPHVELVRDNGLLSPLVVGTPSMSSVGTADGAQSTIQQGPLTHTGNSIMSATLHVPATTQAPVQVERQLPPHVALMANRPNCSLANGNHTCMARPIRPRWLCTICKARQSNWLVRKTCSHWGPCADCLPKPRDMVDNKYENPVAYSVCLSNVNGQVCGGVVKEMLWVVHPM